VDMARHQSEITAEILSDRASIYKLLEKKGFFFKEQFKMVDYYYTHIPITPFITYPELITNSFMLREIVLQRRYVGGESTQLIYKEKKLDSNDTVIGEIKRSCSIGSAEDANTVFTAAGLNNWCRKVITGHVFKKGHSPIELLVQEVEGLGFFLEVEEFEHLRGSSEQRISDLIAFVKELGLPLGDDMYVKINYRLFLKSMKGKNRPGRLYFGAP